MYLCISRLLYYYLMIVLIVNDRKDLARRRYISGVFIEDEEEVSENFIVIEVKNVFEINDGVFFWYLDYEEEIVLKDINVKIFVGKLIMIVG